MELKRHVFKSVRELAKFAAKVNWDLFIERGRGKVSGEEWFLILEKKTPMIWF